MIYLKQFISAALAVNLLLIGHPFDAFAQTGNTVLSDSESYEDILDAIRHDRESILNDEGRAPSAVLISNEAAKRPPNDARSAPNDATLNPNDATRRPNDATNYPNDATNNPNDATLHPNDATQRPNQLMY